MSGSYYNTTFNSTILFLPRIRNFKLLFAISSHLLMNHHKKMCGFHSNSNANNMKSRGYWVDSDPVRFIIQNIIPLKLTQLLLRFLKKYENIKKINHSRCIDPRSMAQCRSSMTTSPDVRALFRISKIHV